MGGLSGRMLRGLSWHVLLDGASARRLMRWRNRARRCRAVTCRVGFVVSWRLPAVTRVHWIMAWGDVIVPRHWRAVLVGRRHAVDARCRGSFYLRMRIVSRQM